MTPRQIAAKRRLGLVELFNDDPTGNFTVDYLAELFQAARVTINKDLKLLRDEGHKIYMKRRKLENGRGCEVFYSMTNNDLGALPPVHYKHSLINEVFK